MFQHEMYVSEEFADALRTYGFASHTNTIQRDTEPPRIETGSKVSLICPRNQALNWNAEVVAIQGIYGNHREQILVFKR